MKKFTLTVEMTVDANTKDEAIEIVKNMQAPNVIVETTQIEEKNKTTSLPYKEGCYELITYGTQYGKAKQQSLGQIMTLREALDLWWNCVLLNIRTNDEDIIQDCYKCFDIIQDCYKCFNGKYELDELDESYLDREIKLDDEYEEDADGYPIVYAELVK